MLRFHATLDDHVRWLGNTETALTGFRHPSKIVNKVEQQIAKHKVKPTDSLQHVVLVIAAAVVAWFIRAMSAELLAHLTYLTDTVP